MEARVHDADGMRAFAREFVTKLLPNEGGAAVVALSGELGAGKTTFVQAAAAALGVRETVNSPTFVIEKIYELSGQKWQRLVHIDAYRLNDAKELRALGWQQLTADTSNLILLEWPERVEDAVPQTARRVRIAIGQGDPSNELGASERTIEYDG